MADDYDDDIELLRARVRTLEGRVEEANHQAEEAQTALEEAEQRATNATEAVNISRELREQAESARTEIEGRLKKTEELLQTTRSDIEKQNQFRAQVEEERSTRTTLRDFVADSLSEIMKGVDDAAYLAGVRQLEERDNAMVSPSRVGPVTTETETLVQFDLAIVANKEAVEELSKARKSQTEAKLSIPLLEVIGLSLGAGTSSSSESRTETRDATTHHNRIQFSVPIIFASQEDRSG